LIVACQPDSATANPEDCDAKIAMTNLGWRAREASRERRTKGPSRIDQPICQEQHNRVFVSALISSSSHRAPQPIPTIKPNVAHQVANPNQPR
jgi:hypothetical protein